jgi:Ca2+-binding RTX toxin-like protein
MWGEAGADRIWGEAGADDLVGGAGADQLIGGAGTDQIWGEDGNDQIWGEAGADQIWGEAGDDAVSGGDGDDLIWGDGGNDLLMGGNGNDTLDGGDGNDIYQFGIGSGADTILQNDGTSLNDTLSVDAGIRIDQIWFDRVANDLRISLIGTSDHATVRDWYTGSEHRLDGFFVTDGSKQMDASQIDQLVAAMATFGVPPAGQFELSQQQHATLDPLLTAAWY